MNQQQQKRTALESDELLKCMLLTPDRRQSKTLLAIDKHGSKSLEQCFRLAFVAGRATNGEMAIKNSFLTIFFI